MRAISHSVSLSMTAPVGLDGELRMIIFVLVVMAVRTLSGSRTKLSSSRTVTKRGIPPHIWTWRG